MVRVGGVGWWASQSGAGQKVLRAICAVVGHMKRAQTTPHFSRSRTRPPRASPNIRPPPGMSACEIKQCVQTASPRPRPLAIHSHPPWPAPAPARPCTRACGHLRGVGEGACMSPKRRTEGINGLWHPRRAYPGRRSPGRALQQPVFRSWTRTRGAARSADVSTPPRRQLQRHRRPGQAARPERPCRRRTCGGERAAENFRISFLSSGSRGQDTDPTPHWDFWDWLVHTVPWLHCVP